MTDLPSFAAKAKVCPKCSHDEWSVTWHTACHGLDHGQPGRPTTYSDGIPDEHLHYGCRTCGWEYVTATADRAPREGGMMSPGYHVPDLDHPHETAAPRPASAKEPA